MPKQEQAHGEETRVRRWTVFACPTCSSLFLPSGDEDKYGPPECNHGLMFGTNPDGGGESECDPVPVIAQQDVERVLREARCHDNTGHPIDEAVNEAIDRAASELGLDLSEGGEG